MWIAALDMNRIGFNDPHLLGIAAERCGVLLFPARPRVDEMAGRFGTAFCPQPFHQANPAGVSRRVAIQLSSAPESDCGPGLRLWQRLLWLCSFSPGWSTAATFSNLWRFPGTYSFAARRETRPPI